MEGHYIITEVDAIEVDANTGENNAKKFVNHCGVLLRDRVRSASMNGNKRRMIL